MKYQGNVPIRCHHDHAALDAYERPCIIKSRPNVIKFRGCLIISVLAVTIIVSNMKQTTSHMAPEQRGRSGDSDIQELYLLERLQSTNLRRAKIRIVQYFQITRHQ